MQLHSWVGRGWASEVAPSLVSGTLLFLLCFFLQQGGMEVKGSKREGAKVASLSKVWAQKAQVSFASFSWSKLGTRAVPSRDFISWLEEQHEHAETGTVVGNHVWKRPTCSQYPLLLFSVFSFSLFTLENLELFLPSVFNT